VSLATRRLRSLLIALAVLALSATAALAGRTVLTTPHSQVATQGQGGDQQAEESESPDPSESEAPEASDAPESPDPSDAGSTDTTDSPTGVHPDNHGKLVSEAARSATPGGFDNHGAYVRTIAQDNAGHAGAAATHAGKHQ
jgi:hypothetical protein